MLRISVLCIIATTTLACTLCPLRVPPRPRPLNQYKLPPTPQFNSEQMPKFCNLSKSLPVDLECRKGFEKIFCTTDKALESLTQCPGPEDPAGCSKCAYQWQESSWVVKWFDSLGKPGAGISDGNYYWLGDYETCQELRSTRTFDGQYCRVELEVPDALIEEGCPQTDPLSVILGVCFPSSCSAQQLTAVSQAFSAYRLRVDCEFDVGWHIGAYIIMAILTAWTAVQMYSMMSNSDKWYIVAMSLKENANRALSTKREVDGLHALHGLEFLTFFAIITGNVYNYMMPYIENVAFIFDGVSVVPMHLTNNYSYQVDGLLALSALYTTYLLYGKLASLKHVLEALKMRFVRFWPAYCFVILFMLFVFVGIASGPMWIHKDTVERCSSSWWKNLLFINDFWPATSTCSDFGYVISLEAQYFVLLVFFIYLARTSPMISMIAVAAIMAASIGITFARVLVYDLPPAPVLTTEPIPVEKMETLLNIVVTSPLCRFSPYGIGFLFGLFMSKAGHEQKDIYGKLVNWVLFALCLLFGGLVTFALLPYVSHSTGSPFIYATYAALHRPLWSFTVLSFLLLCERGWFSWINAILTWRIFSPLSKLTWIALIVSEPVILYFFTALNRPAYATHWSTIYSAISAATMSYLIAFVIDIFVARPIRSLLLSDDRHHHHEPGQRTRPFYSIPQ